ncbi:hypothetical protein L484_002421 [Morus notabilis]|uniref:Uncharacterized protein n=1 Tax=Morus notabilis TaxID=981085 RepID=W9R1Y6_9ROSA|nr:hypothetical protein L484_002421 [Morus notabilis]
MTTPTRALKPNEVYEIIQARVCRIWTNNDFVTGRLISLDCILVDEEVSLWGHKADQFDENVLKTLKAPVVIVFSAMLTKQYLGNSYVSSTSVTIFYIDLDIPETTTLKTR